MIISLSLFHFSTKMTAAQMNYNTFYRELSGIFLALRKYQYTLEDRDFVVYPDHLCIKFCFKQILTELHQHYFISQFPLNKWTFKDRISLHNLDKAVFNFKTIAIDQKSDKISLMMQGTSLQLTMLPSLFNKMILCDTSLKPLCMYSTGLKIVYSASIIKSVDTLNLP